MHGEAAHEVLEHGCGGGQQEVRGGQLEETAQALVQLVVGLFGLKRTVPLGAVLAEQRLGVPPETRVRLLQLLQACTRGGGEAEERLRSKKKRCRAANPCDARGNDRPPLMQTHRKRDDRVRAWHWVVCFVQLRQQVLQFQG